LRCPASPRRYAHGTELACIGGDPALCTKAGLSGANRWGASTRADPALLRHSMTPLSQLMAGFDQSSRDSLEVATRMYLDARNQAWNTVVFNYTHCLGEFHYGLDPTHCPLPPTPAPPTPAPCIPWQSYCTMGPPGGGQEICCPPYDCMKKSAAGAPFEPTKCCRDHAAIGTDPDSAEFHKC
jgi:hypothetical protein